MSQFKPHRIRLRNWMTVRDQVVDIPEKGLIFVAGHNASGASGFESIGTGKTAIGEALAMAVTGVTGRFSSLGYYSTNEDGNTLVVVEGSLGGKPMVIEMGHRCKELSKSGEGLRWSLDGNTTALSKIGLTREALSQALKMTPELAAWTTYVDGDHLDFGALSQAKAVELLMTALGQPSWALYHEKTKKVRAHVQSEMSKLQASRQTLEGLIVSTTNGIETSKAELEREKVRIRDLKAQMAKELSGIDQAIKVLQGNMDKREERRSAIRKLIKEKEAEVAVEFKRLESKEMEARNAKASVSHTKKPLQQEVSTLEAERARLRSNLSTLSSQPKNCPTCKKPWERGPSEEDLEKARKAVDEHQCLLDAARANFASVQALEDKAQEGLEEILREQRTLNVRGIVSGYSSELDDIDTEDRKDRAKIERLSSDKVRLSAGPSEQSIVRINAQIEEKQASVDKYKTDMELAAQEIEGLRETLMVVDYWSTAFSAVGIPNMVLSKSVGPLNHISRSLSHRMSGGTLDISYETEKELASGEQRNSLNVAVKNTLGASRIGGNSKGESGLTHLIIAETLSEVGRVSSRVGFRWYDEVVSNQDRKVRMTIINYLKDTAHRLSIPIFVVDHHPEVASMADYILRATKNGGITTYSWHK